MTTLGRSASIKRGGQSKSFRTQKSEESFATEPGSPRPSYINTKAIPHLWKKKQIARAERLSKIQSKLLQDTSGSDAALRQEEKALKLMEPLSSKKPVVGSRPRHWFDAVVFATIFVSTIQLGVEIDHPEPKWIHTTLNYACTLVFFVEMAVKLCANRFTFFYKGWNVLDFILVCVSILDIFLGKKGSVIVLRALRMLKIVRIFRTFRVCRELWHLFSGVVRALWPAFWVMVLLFLMSYLVGLLCVTWLREHHSDVPDWQETYFGDLPTAMFTLVNVVLVAEYAEFMRPLFTHDPLVCAVIFAFTFFCVFGVLNVLVGTIVDNMANATADLRKEESIHAEEQKLGAIVTIRKLFRSMDVDHSGTLTKEALDHAIHKDDVLEALEQLHLPVGFEGSDLFKLLNDRGKSELTLNDFTRNAVRLISSTDNHFEWQCLVLHHINTVHMEVKALAYRLGEPEPLSPVSPGLCAANGSVAASQRMCSCCSSRVPAPGAAAGGVDQELKAQPTRDETVVSFHGPSSWEPLDPQRRLVLSVNPAPSVAGRTDSPHSPILTSRSRELVMRAFSCTRTRPRQGLETESEPTESAHGGAEPEPRTKPETEPGRASRPRPSRGVLLSKRITSPASPRASRRPRRTEGTTTDPTLSIACI